MNKYCNVCQSVYTATLRNCPKCSKSYGDLPEWERIYLVDKFTGSMDTLTRIERAENELRLAKLDLTNNPTNVNIKEVKAMLHDMCIGVNSYTITEALQKHIIATVDAHYIFMTENIYAGWDASIKSRDDKLIIDFRKKPE